MKENKAFYAVLIALPVLLILFYFFSNNQNKKEINWEENYKSDNQEPYGAFVTYELLKSYNGKELKLIDEPLFKTIKDDKENLSNYVFIGNNLFLTKRDLDTLLQYVSDGNTAFISSKNYPIELMDTIFYGKDLEWTGHFKISDSIMTFNFQHSELNTPAGYKYELPRDSSGNLLFKTYDWKCLNGVFFADSVIQNTTLGYLEDANENKSANFVKLPYGKGFFLFHTSPIVFSNYYLLNQNGLEYTSKVFSHLNKGKIYWDEYNKLPSENSESTISPSPIKMILGNKSLKAAWYLMILLILLYILFFAKRKQRSIPILEANSNTSLEFIKTIGTLYFQQNNHKKLLRLKIKLFLTYIRDKYSLPTNKIDAELIKKISIKSHVPLEEVNSIFNEFKAFEKRSVEINADYLIKVHLHLDNFYKNCK